MQAKQHISHRHYTDEFKVHLADRDVVLRNKRLERVEQEFYALLLTHAAIRRLMTQAAAAIGQVAEDLSFLYAVCVPKRRLPTAIALLPKHRQAWLVSVLGGIAAGRAVTSRGKRNLRGVKRKMSYFNLRKRGDPLN
jgi:hypothetical protein